jgi:hypothetical protein
MKAMKSCGMGLFTIADCLRSGTVFAGGDGRRPDWSSATENKQGQFLQGLLPSIYPCLGHFNEKELRGIARATAEEINAWLEENGSPLRLEPWTNDGNGMGMASILDVTVEWPVVCQPGRVEVEGVLYPSFTAKRKNGFSEVFQAKHHSEPVARMETKNGDSVYFTRWNRALNDEDVPFVIAEIRENLESSDQGFTGVVVPMVDLTLEPDISWTIGLSTSFASGKWVVVQAKQRIRFGMNQFGARAREETAMGCLKSMAPMEKILILDGPFLCWFERPGISFPYVNLLCAPDCFKDPGDLAAMR